MFPKYLNISINFVNRSQIKPIYGFQVIYIPSRKAQSHLRFTELVQLHELIPEYWIVLY